LRPWHHPIVRPHPPTFRFLNNDGPKSHFGLRSRSPVSDEISALSLNSTIPQASIDLLLAAICARNICAARIRGTTSEEGLAGSSPLQESENIMATFLMSLVSPEKMLFAEQVEQADLPGIEGDFGVLSGHAPIVSLLRPGIVTAFAGEVRERFVVLGGLAEFSNEELTILAESASLVADFDLAELKARIEEIQEGLAKKSAGDELDQAIALLDHYKSTQVMLSSTAAF
jgi:F-type H+-transporting ATPase subunit epsilon